MQLMATNDNNGYKGMVENEEKKKESRKKMHREGMIGTDINWRVKSAVRIVGGEASLWYATVNVSAENVYTHNQITDREDLVFAACVPLAIDWEFGSLFVAEKKVDAVGEKKKGK